MSIRLELFALTRYLAVELARPAQPEEITEAVLFLASPRCTYSTGHTIVVDGGLSVTFELPAYDSVGGCRSGAGMTQLDAHYVDPRLVVLYDLENTRGADTDFYLQLAANLNAHTILDLGCGTGLLTCALAGAGHHVIGVDPAPAMLAIARQQPHADQVRWLEGTASMLGTPAADLVVMTGNVAQVFLDENAWAQTLGHIHAALKPGGYLAFESRNPQARAWEQWNRAATYEQFDSPNGPMASWLELLHVAPGRVRFAGHNHFLESGEVVIAESELRFRSQAELTESLSRAGFMIEHVYGDWHHGALTPTSRIMLFIAPRI